jgi:hypothetical protein
MARPFIPYRRIPPPTYNVSKPFYCGIFPCENENETPCEFRFKISRHVDGIRKTRAKPCEFTIEEIMKEIQDTPSEFISEW